MQGYVKLLIYIVQLSDLQTEMQKHEIGLFLGAFCGGAFRAIFKSIGC